MTRPAPDPARAPLAPVPTLDELAADPARAAGLPLDAIRALLAHVHARQGQLHTVEGALLARLLDDGQPEGRPGDDRALGMEEAAQVLGMKPMTLYRKWRTLGIGYRDADGRVKFTSAGLQRYLMRRGG